MSTILETVQSEFDFAVDKFPLFGPDNMATPFYGLFRSDTGECVGRACAEKYVPHQTDDVLALVEAASEAFNGLNVDDLQCYFDNAHHFVVGPSDDKRRNIFGTADNIFPRFFIRGGYDGRGFQAAMGFFRDACSNLAMMRQVAGTYASIRHNSNLRSNMDGLVQTFTNLAGSWDSLASTVAELEDKEVNLTEFIGKCFKPPKEGSKNSEGRWEKRIKTIFHRVREERSRTGRGDLPANEQVSAWEAYNSVQGYVQHVKTRKGSPGSFARVIAATGDTAVQKAESEVLALLSA